MESTPIDPLKLIDEPKDLLAEVITISDPDAPKKSRKLSPEEATELYNIDGWGSGYFSVNSEGNLVMRPQGLENVQISLMKIIDELTKRQIALPCIVRFHDILRDRVMRINKTFAEVIAEASYQGVYRGVYPIKVNQMREVVEEIVDAGRPFHYGLEAGSKAELQIVLAQNTDPEALTICNGYKDSDYLRLALLGRVLERKVVVVVEKFDELIETIRLADEMGVRPFLGLRGKLATRSSGKWQDSGGDHAKFGLGSAELLHAIHYLKQKDMLDCLKLFHFHIGSQIPDIRTVKDSAREGVRIYTTLKKMGAGLEYLDFGGGLGVDYDGSQSKSDYSINYSLHQYVSDIVYNVKQICDEEGVAHPNLVTESGRAITAHHSCLIMNVLDQIESDHKVSLPMTTEIEHSEVCKEITELFQNITPRTARETYHDAMALKEQVVSGFQLGMLTLEERAYVEETASKICRWIVKNRDRTKKFSDEFEQLIEKNAVQYLVNFSVFQSAPDHWAFDQLFPIVPLHRLLDKPQRNCKLVDITCDSDGMIDRFIDRSQDYSPDIWLHQLTGKPYYIGMFLTGAYQDTMGDLHNLFGRVNEIHIYCDDEDPEDFYVEEYLPGDTIRSVIEMQQYSPLELSKSIKDAVGQKMKEGKVKSRVGIDLIDFYDRVMAGYTYLRK